MTPGEASGQGLVVPIRLEALPIGGRDAAQDNYFLPAHANFANLPYKGSGLKAPYLSERALNPPFNGNRPLPQGIHLHWNLPKALRRGAYDNAGKLTLPNVPDRWLVTRVIVDARSQQSAVSLKNWVVESNYRAQNAEHSETTIPQPTAGGARSFAYLGRVYDYEEWLQNGDKGTYIENLTAMGFGIPEFSSYYPNCRNVFGLLDQSLNDGGFDPDKMGLAYAVTGWYRRPEDDPLHSRQISGSGNEFGWLFEGGAGTSPSYSIYHGAVYSVAWNPAPGYAFFPSFADSISPEVVIGNTPMEAFAALTNYQLREHGLKNVERFLNALQLGMLRGLGRPDGLALLEESIHGKAFASADGGLLWDIRPKEAADAPSPDKMRRRPLASLPAGLADDLARLNDLQDEHAQEQGVATSLQAQIFADWYKFMQIQYASDPAQYPNMADVYNFITGEIKALAGINGSGGKIAQVEAQINDLRTKISGELPADVELVSQAAPRYYQPNEPVVLLSGNGVEAAPVDESATIGCVLTSGIPGSITLPKELVGHSVAVGLTASTLPVIPHAEKLPYPAVASLAQSALLLNPATSSVLSAAIAAMGGADNPAVLDFGATTQHIKVAQQEYLTGKQPANGIIFEGSPPQPAIAFRAWGIPWHPMALSWRFNFYPVAGAGGSDGSYPARFVLDNFDFDATSFNYRLKAHDFSSSFQQYSGMILLTPDASLNLRTEISRYLQHESDPELEQILKDLGNYPLLAQALDGFGASLVMLGQTLQMPVADPIATNRVYFDFSNTQVPAAVGSHNRLGPLMSNAYNPLRAGKIVLTRMILIDEFGRYKPVDLSRLIVSETIPTTTDKPPALLPPLRVAQPARLDFRWLSAANPEIQTTSLADTSPICGWIVPNHLADSLMFYDATGAAIGTLTPSGDRRSVVWQVAPQTAPPSRTMQEAFVGRNPVLSEFAFSIAANGAEYLAALIRTIDRTQTFIGPQNYAQDNHTVVLLGTPLAIVQASLGLRLLGQPSPRQSFAALKADIERGDPMRRSDGTFPAVRFPVLLGNLSQLSDGLIGYFTQQSGPGGHMDFSRIYAAAADASNPHIVAPDAGTITLSSADTRQQLITMIIDPRGEVHASTGITPVKALNIPADTYAQALARMTVTFLTTPVLRTPGKLEMPLPSVADSDWKWVSYGQGAWHEADIVPVNPNATLQAAQQIMEGWLKLSHKEKPEA